MSDSRDLRKRDGSVNITKAGRYYTTFYLNEFFEKEREAILAADARANPLKLYVLYESFLREKVLAVNPDLGTLGNESRLRSIVHRLLPEFPQFVAAWLDRFDSPTQVSPLQSPSVVRTKGFAKGRIGEEAEL